MHAVQIMLYNTCLQDYELYTLLWQLPSHHRVNLRGKTMHSHVAAVVCRLRHRERFNHQSLLRLISNQNTDRPLLSFQVIRSFPSAPNPVRQSDAADGSMTNIPVKGPNTPQQPGSPVLLRTNSHPSRLSAGQVQVNVTGGPSKPQKRHKRTESAIVAPVGMDFTTPPLEALETARPSQQPQPQLPQPITTLTPKPTPNTIDISSAQTAGATIVSFKKLELDMGALDFITDQKFLEAVYMYVMGLPMADVWQDDRWQADMQRMQVSTKSIYMLPCPLTNHHAVVASFHSLLHEPYHMVHMSKMLVHIVLKITTAMFAVQVA